MACAHEPALDEYHRAHCAAPIQMEPRPSDAPRRGRHGAPAECPAGGPGARLKSAAHTDVADDTTIHRPTCGDYFFRSRWINSQSIMEIPAALPRNVAGGDLISGR